MIFIKEIDVQETFIVRKPVLRKEKPIESCNFDGDKLASTHHFGLFVNDNLAGVISVFTKSNAVFTENLQAQIRGMAVLENHQKKGFGKTLVEYCEEYCISNQMDLIWFNARTAAVDFYTKMGYLINGTSFDIPEVGEHYLMYKKIK